MSGVAGFLLSGVLLGLSGGLSPGPLLALVASETLRHGVRAGIGVALAPLLTDAPIVLTTVLALRSLTDQNAPLALIHLCGGLYLIWLGLHGWRFRGAALEPGQGASSLWRGVIANVLNPNPYLFWLTVGTPTVLAAWQASGLATAAFVVAFYGMLVGSKMALALALGRARQALRGRGYVLLMRGLGLGLLVYALLFLREGARLLAESAGG